MEQDGDPKFIHNFESQWQEICRYLINPYEDLLKAMLGQKILDVKVFSNSQFGFRRSRSTTRTVGAILLWTSKMPLIQQLGI